MAWPGKLTLTDNALYFEVLIISIWLNEIESNKQKKTMLEDVMFIYLTSY